MENAKQKAIRFAYEELKIDWEWISLFIDFSSGFTFKEDIRLKLNEEDLEIVNNKVGIMWRPKSLQGIETNNGWIRIESEKDLPSEDCDCHIEFSDGSVSISKYFSRERNFLSVHWKYVVAYQKVIKPKKRIY